MPPKPRPGRFYRRKDGRVVGPSTRKNCLGNEIQVGGHYYAGRHNLLRGGLFAHGLKLVADLGTTKPPKKPAKKVRKVRMWFVEAFPGDDDEWFYVRATKKDARGLREGMMATGIECGPIFSQIINVPIPSPKKPKAKK